jgi:hypothetical protein
MRALGLVIGVHPNSHIMTVVGGPIVYDATPTHSESTFDKALIFR